MPGRARGNSQSFLLPHRAELRYTGGRMAFIGIDLGTSFIKGGLLDLERLAVTRVRRAPFPAALPGLPPGHHEVDPRQVMDAARGLVDELAAASELVEGVALCGQMHGLVLTTARGEPRSNVITWQDGRALEPHPAGQGAYFDLLRQRISSEHLRQLGNELRPDQPLARLFWLAEQGRLPDRDLFLASLPDFVAASLCAATPCTDLTNAAAHAALNLETGDWHWELLAGLGLDSLGWPRILPHGAVVGRLRLAGRDVPCYTPVGDYQASLLGSLLAEDELSLNVATGAQVSMARPGLVFGDCATRPYVGEPGRGISAPSRVQAAGRCLITVPNVPAGRSLAALVRLLSELAVMQDVALADPWPAIVAAAAAVSRPRMHVDLAFFDSSCGDQGAITHIREEELTVGHLFRAAFENIVDNFYAAALRLAPEPSWRGLALSGGLVQRIPFLRDLIDERFGVPSRLSPTEEDTLLGLLALALAWTGRAASVAAATSALRQIHAMPAITPVDARYRRVS